MIDMQQMNILIVDDMENMCKAIRGMLKVLNVGRQVYYAYNGLEAWHTLQKEGVGIDLAIIDWNMPQMSGVELLGRIREDARLRDMPVIMVTAEANREIVAQAAESDIDAYLLKPVTVKSLEDRLKMVISKANNPPPMVLHLKKARDLEEKGNLNGAIAEVRQAIEANPSSTRPIRELGSLYYSKGDLDEAEKWLLKAAKLNSLDVIACHALGELYVKKGNMDEAVKYFDRAMQISPRHLERGMNFGKVLLDKNMISKAVKVFGKILELADDPLSLREEIAAVCMEKGEFRYAIQLYTVILQHLPNRTDIMARLVDAYLRSGEGQKAMPYLVELQKKEERNIKLLLIVARSYLALKQTARADQVLQKVFRLDPENHEAKTLIKQCY
jgi:DNA-binding response OmpR family regulator